jgi:hypothetical protein
MKFGQFNLRSSIAALILASGFAQVAQADVIPYANIGSYNPTTYSFTATSTGDVTAYIIGGFSAGYTNQMGLLVNGVLSSAGYGLINHGSSLGQSFDLGSVNAGDTLTFVLHNITLGANAYSDASMNVGYDSPTDTLGHNHIYSTAFTGTSPAISGVPAGTYVAFEDLRFPGADFNYNDESFVFTNTTTHNGNVPEPTSVALLGLGMMALLAIRRRQS